MEKIYAKFPAQPKPASKPAAAAAEVATEVVPFAKRPSVGTWLSPAPKKLGGEQKAPETAPKLPEKTSEPEAAKPLKETPAAPVVQLLPFRDYYEAQVRSLPGMEAPASSETKTTLFQHKPSVATWLNAVPLRKAAPVPPSILDRSRSRIVAMEKEEIVDAVVKEMKQKEQEFASELHKKDEEIARLKALLSNKGTASATWHRAQPYQRCAAWDGGCRISTSRQPVADGDSRAVPGGAPERFQTSPALASCEKWEELVGKILASQDEGKVTDCDREERVLHTAWESAKEIAASPLHMARSAPWDYLRPNVSHEDFLENLLSSKCCEDSVVDSTFLSGAAENAQFIQRYLPGVVNGHPWDGHPTNAISWEFCWPEFVDEPVPFLELARAQIGDDPQQNARVERKVEDDEDEDFEFSSRELQPVTTKAGGRLWSITFAAPGGSVKGLRAAYPYQLLVRFDAGRQVLIYEAFDYLPRTPTHFEMDAKDKDPVTPVELRKIEEIIKRGQRSVLSILGSVPEAPSATAHSERCQEHGIKKLYPLAEWLRFKKSKVRRIRFPLSAICGARLVVLEANRPNGNLPPARGCFPISSLGRRGMDSYKNWRALPGTSAACGSELEPLGLLVLELTQLGMHSGADFAEMPVWATHKDRRLRKACPDWTPESSFSQGKRHYILGDASEIIELGKALATASPALARLLRMSLPDEEILEPAPKIPAHVEECVRRMKNTLASDLLQLSPSRTTSSLSLGSLAARKLASEVKVMKVGVPAKQALPFSSTDEVDSFLRRAGVKKPEEVNLCLKAGMLNGHIPIPQELLEAKSARPFLKQLLYRGKCHGCNKTLACTVRQALSQPSVGYDYGDGGEGGAVMCKGRGGCGEGNYISQLCEGHPSFNCGKFHNHCEECPNFGTCIGDYREEHCHRCGEHFFAGNSGMPCPCRGKDINDFGHGGYDYDSFGSCDSDDSSCASWVPSDDETSPSIPPAGCWDGHLCGVTAASQQQELMKQALKQKPELVQVGADGTDGMPLSKLATLLDQLRPFAPVPPCPDFDAVGEEEEEEEMFEEDPPLG
eukprot:s2330_g13.t5